MNPILVVIPVCAKDAGLAAKLLRWIKRLGPTGNHPCLLAVSNDVPIPESDGLKQFAMSAFGHVNRMNPIVRSVYPQAATELFANVARQINACYRLPWLWLEPDCVPLMANWLDLLSQGYHRQPKRYFGPFVRSDDPRFPKAHLNGVSIYPPNAADDYEPIFREANITKPGQEHKAWDIASSNVTLIRATETDLIQQFWGHEGLPPTFVRAPVIGQPNAVVAANFLKPGAVLFHRCKDGSLIDRLGEMLFDDQAPAEPEAPATPMHVPQYVNPPATSLGKEVYDIFTKDGLIEAPKVDNYAPEAPGEAPRKISEIVVPPPKARKPLPTLGTPVAKP